MQHKMQVPTSGTRGTLSSSFGPAAARLTGMSESANDEPRKRVAKALAKTYSEERDSTTPLRNWIKLAGLACSIPLVQPECGEDLLIDYLKECGSQIASL